MKADNVHLKEKRNKSSNKNTHEEVIQGWLDDTTTKEIGKIYPIWKIFGTTEVKKLTYREQVKTRDKNIIINRHTMPRRHQEDKGQAHLSQRKA